MNKIKLSEEYVNKQSIDYGDLSEKAKEQISQAFIDGFESSENVKFNKLRYISIGNNEVKRIIKLPTDTNFESELQKGVKGMDKEDAEKYYKHISIPFSNFYSNGDSGVNYPLGEGYKEKSNTCLISIKKLLNNLK